MLREKFLEKTSISKLGKDRISNLSNASLCIACWCVHQVINWFSFPTSTLNLFFWNGYTSNLFKWRVLKNWKKRNSEVTINIRKRSLTWFHPAEVLTPSVLKLAKNNRVKIKIKWMFLTWFHPAEVVTLSLFSLARSHLTDCQPIVKAVHIHRHPYHSSLFPKCIDNKHIICMSINHRM